MSCVQPSSVEIFDRLSKHVPKLRKSWKSTKSNSSNLCIVTMVTELIAHTVAWKTQRCIESRCHNPVKRLTQQMNLGSSHNAVWRFAGSVAMSCTMPFRVATLGG